MTNANSISHHGSAVRTRHSKELISHLDTRATDTKGKRKLVKIQGAKGKGGMEKVWRVRNSLRRADDYPNLYGETLGRAAWASTMGTARQEDDATPNATSP